MLPFCHVVPLLFEAMLALDEPEAPRMEGAAVLCDPLRLSEPLVDEVSEAERVEGGPSGIRCSAETAGSGWNL